jgi:hypothetical protein
MEEDFGMEGLKNGERDGPERDGADEERGTLLPDRTFDASDDEDEEELDGGARRSIRPNLWMVLSVLATLAGRRILRGRLGEFRPLRLGVRLMHVLTLEM